MITDFFASLPGLLPDGWWHARWFVLFALGWTAWIDAWSGRVPRPWIWAGGLVALYASQSYEGWHTAGVRLTMAMATYLVLRGLNEAYYRLFKRDPYGYGDMRWSALVAFSFGLAPVFWSWAIGAWIGIIWMLGVWGLRFLTGRGKAPSYIHFAPFLMIGLLIALYGMPYARALLSRI